MKARPLGVIALALAVPAVLAAQECRVAASSNEGRLLAFYAVPIAFTPAMTPEHLAPGAVRLSGEVTYVPQPDSALRVVQQCYTKKSENTNLSRVFPRPHITIGLPDNLVLDASYLPPVTVANAQPNLASAALSWIGPVHQTPGGATVFARFGVHGTVGRVTGPITCSSAALQMSDSSAPCYGSTPSHDSFHPTMYGGEASLSWISAGGAVGAYVGGGISRLAPGLRVNFTSALGFTDSTLVDTRTTRGAFYAGASLRVARPLAVSFQFYDAPADAATVRFGLTYDLRR